MLKLSYLKIGTQNMTITQVNICIYIYRVPQKDLYKVLGEEDKYIRTIFTYENIISVALVNHRYRVSYSNMNENLPLQL